MQRQLSAVGRIAFATGSAALTARATAQLARVAAILKASPRVHIQIQGNTDSVGSAAANLTLSRARANAVYHQLRADGISASRMTTVGYGESRPKVPNTTAANRAINRRVDLALSQ